MAKHNYVNLDKLPANRRPDWKPWEALAKARQYDGRGHGQCDHGHSFLGYCAHLSFCAYGMVSSGYVDAHSMWYNTPSAFKRFDRNPPAGAIALYVGGNHGHAALVNVQGGIMTNDIENGRYVGGAYSRASLLSPERAFGHRYVGWIYPYAISSEDSRTPPKTKVHGGDGHHGGGKPKDLDFVPGWFKVTASALNGRERPSTKSDVGNRWERGDLVFLEKAVRHEGRRWLKTDKAGLWVAAGYVDRRETVKKDRKDHKAGKNQGPGKK